MLRSFYVVATLLVMVLAVAVGAQDADPTERTVCGRVQKVTCEQKGARSTTLELKPKSKDLPVTIPSASRIRFNPRPEELYRDTEVCVTGRVESEGAQRLLVVSRPEDVVIRKHHKRPAAAWATPHFTECDDGVVPPVLIKNVPPNYTGAALGQQIAGIVELQAIVRDDGTVGEMRIQKSLDRQFGLDNEALKAVRQWRFAPATRFGRPVPLLVEVHVSFEVTGVQRPPF